MADSDDNRFLSADDYANNSVEPTPRLAFVPQTGDLVLELRGRVFDAPQDSLNITLLSDQTGANVHFGVLQGEFVWYDGGTVHYGDSIQHDQWYDFSAEVDMSAGTYIAYCDGVPMGGTLQFKNPTDTLTRFQIAGSEAFDIDDVVIRPAHSFGTGEICDYHVDCASGICTANGYQDQ